MVKRYKSVSNQMIEDPTGDWVSFQDFKNVSDCLRIWFSLDTASLPADELNKTEKYRNCLIGLRDFLQNQKESCFGYEHYTRPDRPGFSFNKSIRDDIINEIEKVIKNDESVRL